MQLGYIEERNIGIDFHKHYAVFSPDNSFVAIISDEYAIVFDTESGRRIAVLFCEVPIVGLKWNNASEVITLTEGCEVISWDIHTSSVKKRCTVNYNGKLKYAYNVGDLFFVVACSNGENDALIRVDIEKNTTKLCTNLYCTVVDRRKVSPAFNYVVVADKLVVHYIPYDAKTARKGEFLINLPFADEGTVLSSVMVVRDCIFAVVNCGRIYCWSDVETKGIKNENHFFFHAHHSDVRAAITSLLTLICGTSNCNVDKWSLMSTGRGRCEKRQTVERMDAPIENVFLSSDDSLLLVVMTDNSLVVLNSSSLAVVSRPQVLIWPLHAKPSDWLSISTDAENPDYIVTNARFGCIQWIDPTKWRTVSEVDICKENSPSVDGPAKPHYNWCNIYQIALSANLLVTVECRRFNDDKSHIRFFKRITSGSMNDVREMDCVPVAERMKFVRLSLEDAASVSDELQSKEYLIAVNFTGNISVYKKSSSDSEKWNKDFVRSMNWQQTTIKDCSTIRKDFMAAVHANKQDESSTVVVIWNTQEFTITAFLDEISDVSEIRWCPRRPDQEFVLILASKLQLTAYDSSKQCYLWTIFEPDLHIYTNPFCIVAYRQKCALVLSNDGSINEKINFSHDQLRVVATGSTNNVRMSGLGNIGLSLLKLENEENKMSLGIRSHKFTPFSAFVQNNKQFIKSRQLENLDLRRSTSARKILQGSIQTLVPISKLAPGYIHNCLLKKSVQ